MLQPGRILLPLELFIVSCISLLSSSQVVVYAQTMNDFHSDPGWEGVNNRAIPASCPETTQDFGFSSSRNAGGSQGEIGGFIKRSNVPAFYANVIATKTLADSLEANGQFAVTESQGGSGMLFGWFNEDSRGWRTPNSLAFRLDGEGGFCRVLFEYGTSTWKTGGSPPIAEVQADGSVHTWSLAYEPNGAQKNGIITFTLDGDSHQLEVRPEHKASGAQFNRFGMFNQMIAGDGMTVYFDDVTINGNGYAFGDPPADWDGLGNDTTFEDCLVRPWHDFGYSSTQNAGGQSPGEIGGIIWRIESSRPENAAYYGDADVGPLTLDDPLNASGKVGFLRGSSDSATLLGWFNSSTAREGISPPENFLGILVEGPSRAGFYFRPVYRNSISQDGDSETGPEIIPDGSTHDWSLDYDPKANGGRGRITVTLDGQPVSLNLGDGHRQNGAIFDRFGIVTWQTGGHFQEIYFDDLTYTNQKPTPTLTPSSTPRPTETTTPTATGTYTPLPSATSSPSATPTQKENLTGWGVH